MKKAGYRAKGRTNGRAKGRANGRGKEHRAGHRARQGRAVNREGTQGKRDP